MHAGEREEGRQPERHGKRRRSLNILNPYYDLISKKDFRMVNSGELDFIT